MDMKDQFRRVLDDFKKKAELTSKELKYFQFTDFDDVLTTLSSIQKEQSKRKTLLYMKRIEPFLKTMAEYGKVIEVFVNTSEILAFVWGPLKFLITVASSFIDAFNSLLDIYQHIGEQIPLLESYKELFSENAHMRQLLVMIYEDILRVHVIALRYFRQKVWRSLFQTTWKGFASEIDLLKDNLSRHRRLIETRASLVEFEAVQSIRTQSEANFRELKLSEDRRRKMAVFQWLSSPDVQAAHERCLEARAWDPKSCHWILADSCFQEWAEPVFCSTPLLWINGKPGAGKSVLASVIIECVKEIKDVSVAFFYFANGNPERDKFVPMARGILSQLVTQDTSLLLHFEKVMTSSGQAVLSSRDLARELLDIALKSRKTYIILDGIDECARDDRKEICNWFRSFADSLPTAKQDEIRCLFISQDDGFARKDLSMLPTLSITDDQTRGDITEYALHWQKRIEERFGPLQELGSPLAKIVPERSQGMFIFAKCVLKELYQQPSKAHLLHKWGAERFPTTLEEVYDRILQRLLDSQTVPEQCDITKKLLSWISLSRRPLRWYEIQAAISIDLENDTINESNRRLVDTSKDLCASFVEIHADQTVEFVHSTVRDFLKSEGAGVVDSTKVELELCLLSIAYLNFFVVCAPDRDALVSGQLAFYDYAVASWVHHLMAWLSDTCHDKSGLLELEETFGPFLDRHFSDQCPTNNVSNQMHEKLRPMKDFECYDSLAQAIMWSRKQLLVADSLKNDGDIQSQLDFPSITRRIRALLEDTVKASPTPEIRAALELYYGRKWFRCPRIYCRHFYDGFEVQDDRDTHVARHERAYMCTFDGCHMATIGCISKKDLDKHLFETHGVGGDGGNFPNVQDPNTARIQKHPATYQCALCPKRFTRSYNLRSHLRTHRDERPFVCTVCGKAFTRIHDRKMHERLHLGEKLFICQGDLKAGGQWGCGRRFARAAALGRHFRSETGRTCTKPLDEGQQQPWEADPQRRVEAEQRQQQQQLASLPAALLEQYPTLAQMDWSQEIGEDEVGEAD